MDFHAPTLVTFDDHLSGLAAATDALCRAAGLTWLGARVPTCPKWDVLDLVAHQGMVHRWATAALRADPAGMGNAPLAETEGRTSGDPLAWLHAGATDLAAALEDAPDDLETLTFLKAAPPPRQFWARRQCHETTVHALDAVAAEQGRALRADDAWFGQDLAADGVDELLLGFWPRSKGRLRSTTPYAVRVLPTDVPLSWVVEVSDAPVRSRRVVGPDADDPAVAALPTVRGSAVDLYLRLWNRGGTVSDDAGVLEAWSVDGAVTW